MAVVENPGTALDARAPDFELPDTDGNTHRLTDAEGAPATVVYFTCNHCPYAVAWQERLNAVAREYADRAVKVFAINSNDAANYPADSYEAMQRLVADNPWPNPYLYDESQEVAHAYDAKTTPDVFVLDPQLKIRYRGAPDANYKNPVENASYIRAALDALLTNQPINTPETSPVGCSIKWK